MGRLVSGGDEKGNKEAEEAKEKGSETLRIYVSLLKTKEIYGRQALPSVYDIGKHIVCEMRAGIDVR